MPRTTDKPRLAKLNPHEVGAIIDQRTDAALEQMIQHHLFDGSVELRSTKDNAPVYVALARTRTSDLAMTAGALTEYAQRGLPVWDWGTVEEVQDALMQIVSRLYSRPADALAGMSDHVGPLAEDPDLAEADLDDPVAIVLIAAQARVDLHHGLPLTVRSLAALASLDESGVRKIAGLGDLTLEGSRPARASAEESRRWLGSRGIKGL